MKLNLNLNLNKYYINILPNVSIIKNAAYTQGGILISWLCFYFIIKKPHKGYKIADNIIRKDGIIRKTTSIGFAINTHIISLLPQLRFVGKRSMQKYSIEFQFLILIVEIVKYDNRYKR